jgi:hypothetical protein
MNEKTNIHVPERLHGRLTAYATLAAATLAAPALPSAHALIIYSGPININIPSTTAGVYLNVVTGVTGASEGQVPGWDVNPWSATALNMWATVAAGNAYVGSGNNYFNIPIGSFVGSSSSFTTGNSTTLTISPSTPLNLNSFQNFIGFRFLNESNGLTNYGWMRISLGATVESQPRAIVEYSYEDSGAGIGVGVIPEPSTVALLGLAAAAALGVRVWRRQMR